MPVTQISYFLSQDWRAGTRSAGLYIKLVTPGVTVALTPSPVSWGRVGVGVERGSAEWPSFSALPRPNLLPSFRVLAWWRFLLLLNHSSAAFRHYADLIRIDADNSFERAWKLSGWSETRLALGISLTIACGLFLALEASSATCDQLPCRKQIQIAYYVTKATNLSGDRWNSLERIVGRWQHYSPRLKRWRRQMSEFHRQAKQRNQLVWSEISLSFERAGYHRPCRFRGNKFHESDRERNSHHSLKRMAMSLRI